MVLVALVVVAGVFAVLLVSAGGFRVWDASGATTAEGGCGSVRSTGEILLEANEANCSHYRVVRTIAAAALILVLTLVLSKGRHRLRASLLGAILVALSAATPFLPIRPIESDFSGWCVHHATYDCSEFLSHLDLVGTTTWTDATEDDQCHEHLSPLRTTGRVLLGGGMVILTFAGVRRATRRWRWQQSPPRQTSLWAADVWGRWAATQEQLGEGSEGTQQTSLTGRRTVTPVATRLSSVCRGRNVYFPDYLRFPPRLAKPRHSPQL